MRRFAIAVIVAVCLGAPVAEMFDQWDHTLQDGNDTEANVMIVAELVEDVKELPSRENLLWVGIGSGLALAAHPFDDDVNRKLVGSTAAEHFFKAGEILGELGTLLGSASAIYAAAVSETSRACHTSVWI